MSRHKSYFLWQLYAITVKILIWEVVWNTFKYMKNKKQYQHKR